MAIFSFFSGVGMLDLGFEHAGFNIVMVNEYEKSFLDSYIYARRNCEENVPEFGYYNGDIRDFLIGDMQVKLNEYIETVKKRNEIVGFIGGPPCPDFSVGGKNLGKDGERGKLAKTYVELIIQNKPDFFLFENVKGMIKTEKHREYYYELQNELINAGYSISDKMVNSLSYGVAQDRERILMIGIKRDSRYASLGVINNEYFDFPWTDNQLYNSDEIKLLEWPDKDIFVEGKRRMFKYNVPIELTVEHWFKKNCVNKHVNSKDIFNVKKGKEKIEKTYEGDTTRKSFKRLHRWRYSPTAAYGNNEVHLHPYKKRRLSVAEAMAIQSLPIWFELPPKFTLTSKFKMVGNGVPYLLSRSVAVSLYKYLNI